MASAPLILEQALARSIGEEWHPCSGTRWNHPLLDAVGPVLCSFAHWIASQHDPNQPLFCILREGQLIGHLVQALGIPAVHDISLNRRLCLKAAVLSAEDEEGLLNILTRARRRPMMVKEAIIEMELPHPPLPGSTPLVANSPELAAFLSWLREPGPAEALITATSGLRTRLLAYLERIGALDNRQIILADLGYATNIQNALQKILQHEKKDITTLGLYLLTTPGASWTIQRGGTVRSYLAHLGKPEWFTHLFTRTPEPLETLCTNVDGPLIDYTVDGLPVRLPSLLPLKQTKAVKLLQAALLTEAKASLRIHAAAARLKLARFLSLPTLEETDILAPWVYEETLDASTRRLAPASVGNPWNLDRTAMPWPAGAARQAGWTDEQLLYEAKALALPALGPENQCCP
ncbi:hypothetical protein HEQ62_05515 [Haematospirillum jordaniae]|uniref:Uncharacterized protein n=1 Tax=Haematospirillum jordaniae TaxID=1549855 RepID=A0A143DCD3_9PROT|nr:hypothetical protein [Haematospirillum jordaniae]AMW34382.1 hypothetical protein AY555_03350 [Haematospirillum jordaniae]NKD44646.1 hypothetical protein [Haematospirillum jordaniae]NKD57666.1 hypothetical protein [Haematospirillum jordaniae]NKD59236.1 hypothetical protein [Haematospirillum jordaniae]NKD67374.1 hypothetical protein [Haematospirillum jordaniae]